MYRCHDLPLISADADCDNGAGLHGTPRLRGCNGDVAPRIDAWSARRRSVGVGGPRRSGRRTGFVELGRPPPRKGIA